MSSTLEIIEQPESTPSATRVDKNPMNLAAGWYIAMESKDLGKKPKAIELFGLPLVAWRDQTAHPAIMQRHCSHMGASLAMGKIVNGCIQCPYHHWRYDASGKCISIPEVEYIPKTAGQISYVTAERYGYIWVWYGSQNPLFALPEFSAAEEQRYNYIPARFVYTTKTTVLRLSENAFDYHHLIALHGQKISGPIQLTLLNNQHLDQHSNLPVQKEVWFGALVEFPVPHFSSVSAGVLRMRVDSWPGGHMATAFADGKERLRSLVCLAPVAENKTIAHILLMVKKTGNPLLDILSYLMFHWRHHTNFAQDMDVWKNMNLDIDGVYTKHDLAILKYREFYQRWVDKVG